MSGHSKWHTIKHAKGLADAKRGQLFTKLTREIIVAVRQGGSNSEMNARLRLAIQKAKDNSMPYDNINRAIQKGSGTFEGATMAEMVLEGHGPGGVAIMVQALSDNRNRTIQEVRNIFTRAGGSLSDAGSVAWNFDYKGVITLKVEGFDPDEVSLMAIDAGAEDIKVEDNYLEIHTKPEDMEKVRKALEQKNIAIDSADLNQVPKTTVELTDEKASLQNLKLLEKLEELDEVQLVSSNANVPDAIMEKFQMEAV